MCIPNVGHFVIKSLRGKLGTTPSQKSTSSSSPYDAPNCQQAIGSSTRSIISESPNALSSNVADIQKHSISRQDNQVQDRAGDLSKISGSITAKSARGDNDEAIGKLQEQVRSLELQLDSPSLSQAKRYFYFKTSRFEIITQVNSNVACRFALKKEAAKARANIIRLKRQAEISS